MPWGHNLVLLPRLKQPERRLAYAHSAIEHGWSRNVLNIHIETRQLEPTGRAITSFGERLPAPGSDLARKSLKDPYLPVKQRGLTPPEFANRMLDVLAEAWTATQAASR